MDPTGRLYFMISPNAPGGPAKSGPHERHWPIEIESGSVPASPHQRPTSTGHCHPQAMEKCVRQAIPLLT